MGDIETGFEYNICGISSTSFLILFLVWTGWIQGAYGGGTVPAFDMMLLWKIPGSNFNCAQFFLAGLCWHFVDTWQPTFQRFFSQSWQDFTRSYAKDAINRFVNKVLSKLFFSSFSKCFILWCKAVPFWFLISRNQDLLILKSQQIWWWQKKVSETIILSISFEENIITSSISLYI